MIRRSHLLVLALLLLAAGVYWLVRRPQVPVRGGAAAHARTNEGGPNAQGESSRDAARLMSLDPEPLLRDEAGNAATASDLSGRVRQQRSDPAWERVARESQLRVARLERFIRRAGLSKRRQERMLTLVAQEAAKLSIMRDILRAGADPQDVFKAMRTAQRETDREARRLLPARKLARFKTLRSRDRKQEQQSLVRARAGFR